MLSLNIQESETEPNKENCSKPEPKNQSLHPLTLQTLISPRGIAPQTTRNCQTNPSTTHEKNYKPLTVRNTPKQFFEHEGKHEPTKCSVKENGIVKAYAACTNQGLVRNFNEDRVSIVLNISKPASFKDRNWPKCSFFGVYDGHGGSACADYLRDNLHKHVIHSMYFPGNPKEALKEGFQAAERAFLEKAQKTGEKSGSCAIVLLVIGKYCYVANVGDSRAIMSADNGSKVYLLSKDHKPSDTQERTRIEQNGGRVYQSVATSQNNKQVLGPQRVLPGRLSVSRTFGDIEAKNPSSGGNPKVLVCEPEIKAFKLSSGFDFVVMASDGIFDKLTNREVVQSAWSSAFDQKAKDLHRQCAASTESIMRSALNKRTLDNITVVMVAFENFQQKHGELP